MRLLSFLRFVALLCAIVCAAGLAHADDIKSIQPTGYVTDLAGVIDAPTTARLEALCLEVQQKTDAQIAVVTVRSLDDNSVEQYAVDLYKQLGIGSKKENRGVLLLLAPADRKYRIEVGYGLEPVINDARAGDAGRAMVPQLRQGDFSGAAETATWILARYIAADRGVTLSGQQPVRHVQRDYRVGDSGFGFLGPFIIIGIFLLIAAISSRRGGGGGSGCLWFLLGMLMNSGGRSGGGSSWGGGGFGGGSDGGGFGGFGGGSSGGGGASGSW